MRFDYGEMAIRKHIHWNGKRYMGFVNCGFHKDSDALPEAKKALVFLIVGLNTHWKISVGYFLLNGLSSEQKTMLVKKCLKLVHDSGAKTVSLTFDGSATNLAVASQLGASLYPSNIEPWFKHPCSNERVHIILNPCHVVKLVRNALRDWVCNRRSFRVKGKLAVY